MTPETARDWILVMRDAAIVVVAASLLLWQGIFTRHPNEYVLGVASALLVAPAALRLDEARRQR